MDLDRLQTLAEAKAGEHAQRPNDKTIDRAGGQLNHNAHALIKHAQDAQFALGRIVKNLQSGKYLDDQDYDKALNSLESFRADGMTAYRHVKEIFDSARTLQLPHKTAGHGYDVDDL